MSVDSFGQGENWDVYMAQYEKGAGSTILDLSYKTTAPLKKYPFLLVTGVITRNCGSDGLPEKSAFEDLYKVSDKLKIVIDNNYENKFVGTFTYQCKRSDYYYLTDTINLRQKLDSFYKKEFPTFDKTIKIQADSKWDTYLTFLYPNEETLEYMSDQKVVLSLTNAGDNLTQPRKVDHWLYFNNSIDRDKFAKYIVLQNFTIEKKQFMKDSELQYELQISRVDKVNLESITQITRQLRNDVSKFNGNYDGWETFVIK